MALLKPTEAANCPHQAPLRGEARGSAGEVVDAARAAFERDLLRLGEGMFDGIASPYALAAPSGAAPPCPAGASRAAESRPAPGRPARSLKLRQIAHVCSGSAPTCSAQ